MLPPNALVVVADGRLARLFRNKVRSGVELSEMERVTPEILKQLQAGEGDAQIGLIDENPQIFAAQLADYLNALVLKHKADDVVVIADPSTLGILRKRYHKELQFRLHREIDKNLTNSDLRAIEDALS